MTNFIEGLLLSGGLIIAVGAQNAYVLRQGMLRARVFVIVLICSLSDLLLFSLATMGSGTLLNNNQQALALLTLAGIAFLSLYGLQAAWRAGRGQQKLELPAATAKPQSLASTIAVTLALTYLNPHVYLDTLVIFGSLVAPLDWPARWQFLAGAGLASCLWFVALGYGARYLLPLFQKSLTWRLLDAAIAFIMFWLAASLTNYYFLNLAN